MKQLILGGARSGKSRLAEELTAQYGDNIAYVATTDRRFNDAEMDDRIAHHQRQRPAHWHTIETPTELSEQLLRAHHYDCMMVDCLTLWLTNCLINDDVIWSQKKQDFLHSLEVSHGNIVLVANEVGMGVVPMDPLSRRFVDESGFLHQATANVCDRVVFTAAGLPLVMKGTPL